MYKLKQLLLCFVLISLLLPTSCKKDKHYEISEFMQEYFSYQKDSYWIYKNDSTGLIDSTYVKDYSHVSNDGTYPRISRELIKMYFKSIFLSMESIGYLNCGGTDYLQISGIINPNPGEGEFIGPVAFDDNWPANTKIIPGCEDYGTFFYKTFLTTTINNVPYQNVIYSEFKSTDSSATNPALYIRKIYFANNIGIVKYYEFYPYYRVNRSFSLLRYKVVQ